MIYPITDSRYLSSPENIKNSKNTRCFTITYNYLSIGSYLFWNNIQTFIPDRFTSELRKIFFGSNFTTSLKAELTRRQTSSFSCLDPLHFPDFSRQMLASFWRLVGEGHFDEICKLGHKSELEGHQFSRSISSIDKVGRWVVYEWWTPLTLSGHNGPRSSETWAKIGETPETLMWPEDLESVVLLPCGGPDKH